MGHDTTNRRGFLKLMGAAGVGIYLQSKSGIGNAASAGASSGEIQIAGLGPLSGPYAAAGKSTLQGGELWTGHVGEILGKKLKHVPFNTKIDVATARRIVSDAMQNDGIKLFYGVASSAVAAAVEDVTNRYQGVFITSVGADDITGKNCKESTFRWSLPAYGAVRETVEPMLKADSSLKRWYSITPNYNFGKSLLSNSKEIIEKNGAELVGNSYHSLSQTDFTSYILNAMSAKPDVLLLLNFGAQALTSIKEALAYGLNKRMKILTVWSSGLQEFQAIGADSMEGLYFGCQYWHEVDTPANKQFVKLSKERFGQVPNYPMATGYVESQMLTMGMKRAGSADPAAIIKALEGLHYDGLTGKEFIRSEDHQTRKKYYLLKGKAKSDMKNKNDYVDIISSGASLVPLDDMLCKMKPWGS